MQLYLIRHGQSYMNVQSWSQVHGYQNVGLTEKGQRQAAALGAWLPTLLPAIDALYCSTLLRTRETAAPIVSAYGCEVTYDDRLREIGTNHLNHTPWSDDVLPLEWADSRTLGSFFEQIQIGR